ncbi:MAG: hypothetical protein JW724_03995 [Candidatus Altiarchaeota archaeon]|nr:hypothetical protein [Candidatus Altiarchaeota archaeon]
MFDNLYTRLTGRVQYKTLIFVPVILSAFMILLIYVNGVPMGLDFRGGTLIDVSLEPGSVVDISGLSEELAGMGLEDLNVSYIKAVGERRDSVRISTLSFVMRNNATVDEVLARYLGPLRYYDEATLQVENEPPENLAGKLSARLNQDASVEYDKTSQILKVTASTIDKGELESALDFYLQRTGVQVVLAEKNIQSFPVNPALAEKLKNDGLKAAIFGYLLMAFVIFIAFRDLIPSIAVLLAATFDAIMALGFMSIFGIVLEPASLVALLMLVGYSVDTDVLLTSRILRKRKGNVNEGIDRAIKTGLTMTGTTLVVMLVVVIVSSTIAPVPTITSIASVLLLGLVADLATTWFMNAGILKWYVEERGGSLDLLKKGKKSVSKR